MPHLLANLWASIKSQPTTHYLGHLLAFLSHISSILSLQVEAGSALLDLTTALRPMCPLRGFSNLRTASIRLIKLQPGNLRGLLDALACSSHAILWLSSYREFTIKFRPAESFLGLPDLSGRPPLARVTFVFATEEGLLEFLDIAAARTGGLKTICTSSATIQELYTSGRWSMTPMDAQTCNKKDESGRTSRWHAHIRCAGDEGIELCLVPMLKDSIEKH